MAVSFKPETQPLKSRSQWLWAILAGGLVIVGGRFWFWSQDLRVIKMAQQQQTRHLDAFVPRLTITDRQQTILATDQVIYKLYIHPLQFAAQAKQQNQGADATLLTQLVRQQLDLSAQLLAPLLQKTPAQLMDQLADSRHTTTVLAKKLDAATYERLTRLRIPRTVVSDPEQLTAFRTQNLEALPKNLQTEIPGLEKEAHRKRTYALGAENAAILGFVAYNKPKEPSQTSRCTELEQCGLAGLEQSYEKILNLPPTDTLSAQAYGPKQIRAASAPMPFMPTTSQQTLQLALDTRFQHSAALALTKGMAAYRAQRGTAMVMEAATGAIRALAVAPTYDNNQMGRVDPKLFRPWAITDIYEPGSTFKPVNIAIGIESGKVKATDTIVDTGSLTLSQRTIHNFDNRARGLMTVTQVLQFSNNIGMVKLMRKLNPGDYYDRLRDIGIGKQSGVDMFGEGAGIFKSRKNFIRYPIEAATPAFGQGITMTPLQLLRFHAAIANGGNLVTPYLAEALTDSQGHVLVPITHRPPRRIFSEETTRQVRQMLIAVVEGGSGKAAQIPGYWLGGKTGTAQKVSQSGGYVPGARVTSFVGYLPGNAPKYVVLVVFDQPAGKVFGGNTAAPVVHEIMKDIIGYEGILPTRPLSKNQKGKFNPNN